MGAIHDSGKQNLTVAITVCNGLVITTSSAASKTRVLAADIVYNWFAIWL